MFPLNFLTDYAYLDIILENRSQNKFLGESLPLSHRREVFFSHALLICVADDSDLDLVIYICSKKFDFVFLHYILQISKSLSILIMSFNCLKPLPGWYNMVITIFYPCICVLIFLWLIKLLGNSESKLDLNGTLPDSAFHLLFFGHNLLRDKYNEIVFHYCFLLSRSHAP